MRSSIDRRRFLRGAATAIGGYALLGSPMARAFTMSKRQLRAAGVGGDGRPRVYVIVLDGLRPDEITPELMPNLVSLREQGASYTTARSLMVAETLPNHVAMMTGHAGGVNGVPANDIWDHELGDSRKASRPEDLRVETVLSRLGAEGLTTASVLSKQYLFDVFQGQADHHWEPSPQIPDPDEHAPDLFTMDEIQRVVDEHDPDFLFANLGDIDRAGHIDYTGPTPFRAVRTAALADTDGLVGDFVSTLQDGGTWEATTLIITADHSMDWSLVTDFVSLAPAFDDDDVVAGNYAIADNGGANLAYWTGEEARREEGVGRMLALAAEVDGVESVVRPQEVMLDRKAGDVVAFCEPGRRFSEPELEPSSDFFGNPIPGNHGHKVTLPIPMIVSGGVEFVKGGREIGGVTPRTWDVAPTVAWLFGVDGADTVKAAGRRYAGSVLADAFSDLNRGGNEQPATTTSVPSTTSPSTTTPAGVGAAGLDDDRGPTPATGGPGAAAGIAVGAASLGLRSLRRRLNDVSVD